MRIIVPIKQILDPDGITFRRDKERMFVNREDYVIEPGSRAALEAALRVKDTAEGKDAALSNPSVVAMSMGQPRADDALREALALGCDAAYLLTDSAFEQADVSVTTRILATAIDKLGGADMIVVGNRSGDTGAGQIGPRLAEALGYTGVADVMVLAVADGTAEATRRWGNAYVKIEAPMPSVVSVAPEAFPARYPHGARIMNAYREWDVTTWDAADLNLGGAALEPLLASRGKTFPPPVETGEEFRGDPDSVAREVVMALRLQKVIG